MIQIFSLWLVPWAAVSRLVSAVPSPFPAALACTAFAIPYHAIVLGDPALYSAIFHIVLVLVSEFDASLRAILFSAFVFAVYLTAFDFVRIYSEEIPRLHKETHSVWERMQKLWNNDKTVAGVTGVTGVTVRQDA